MTIEKPSPGAGWITHDGGLRPCAPDQQVIVLWRDGDVSGFEAADIFVWQWTAIPRGRNSDVVAWRPVDYPLLPRQTGGLRASASRAAQAIEARRAETQGGSVHESAVAKPCAQTPDIPANTPTGAAK